MDSIEERAQWYKKDMFEAQPYMSFGVATDDSFKVKKDGQTVENIYAVGSILSGFNAMKEGCGAGVALLTAMQVSSNILQSSVNE